NTMGPLYVRTSSRRDSDRNRSRSRDGPLYSGFTLDSGRMMSVLKCSATSSSITLHAPWCLQFFKMTRGIARRTESEYCEMDEVRGDRHRRSQCKSPGRLRPAPETCRLWDRGKQSPALLFQ